METPYQTWPNDNCLDRANTTLGTLERDPLHQDWSSTLGCASCSNHFKSNWNHVYIRYCDGGTYAGTLNHSFAGKYSNGTVGEVFFQGKYILQDVDWWYNIHSNTAEYLVDVQIHNRENKYDRFAVQFIVYYFL